LSCMLLRVAVIDLTAFIDRYRDTDGLNLSRRSNLASSLLRKAHVMTVVN
jgi:hypothetical protein